MLALILEEVPIQVVHHPLNQLCKDTEISVTFYKSLKHVFGSLFVLSKWYQIILDVVGAYSSEVIKQLLVVVFGIALKEYDVVDLYVLHVVHKVVGLSSEVSDDFISELSLDYGLCLFPSFLLVGHLVVLIVRKLLILIFATINLNILS